MSGPTDPASSPRRRAPFYVLEGDDPAHRRHLFTFLDVDWLATPNARLAPIWLLVVGLLIGFRTTVGGSFFEDVGLGIGYAILIAFAFVWHQVGGIVGGLIMDLPPRAVVFTATLPYQVYPPESEQPSRVHVARAMGGPLANFALGWLMLIVFLIGVRHPFVGFVALTNMLIGLVALIPLPGMDGGVVLRELRHWRSDAGGWRIGDGD